MPAIKGGRIRSILLILSSFLGALVITLGPARSQTKTDARPRFELASIKLATDCGRTPNDPGPRGPGASSPGRLEIRCASVEALIQRAYVGFANGVSLNRAELEIKGGPDWSRSARYDVAAKAENAAHVAEMSGPMLQQLLEDRFQLKIHRETKPGDVYELTVAKTGLKLKPTKEGSCTPRDLDHWPPTPPAPGQPNTVVCGAFRSPPSTAETMKLEADGMTITDFFAMISTLLLQEPVVDKTGLTTLFDFPWRFRGISASTWAGATEAGIGHLRLNPQVRQSPQRWRTNSA